MVILFYQFFCYYKHTQKMKVLSTAENRMLGLDPTMCFNPWLKDSRNISDYVLNSFIIVCCTYRKWFKFAHVGCKIKEESYAEISLLVLRYFQVPLSGMTHP